MNLVIRFLKTKDGAIRWNRVRLLLAIFVVVGLIGQVMQRFEQPAPPSTRVFSPSEAPAPTAKEETTKEAEATVSQGSGTWNSYRYSFVEATSGPNTGKTVVTFTPFLPRNDEVLIGAMRHISARFYKMNTESAGPELIPRNGINLLALRSASQTAMFTLVKEDTGEIHSFVTWRE